MSDSASIGIGGAQATATVDDETDPKSPVTVTTRSGYTVRFGDPAAGRATFEDKHLRRLRRTSMDVLQNAPDGNKAAKLAAFHTEATKAAGERWRQSGNPEASRNSLVMMPLSSYCQLGTLIATQAAALPAASWVVSPMNANVTQVHLTLDLPQSLAYNANGFGQTVAAGVGVRLGATVERHPNDRRLLTVVHLAHFAVQNPLKSNDRRTAASVASRFAS